MADQLAALLTLMALEIVLGIDNVIFISILSAKLPEVDQAKARRLGIGLAVVSRILLLLSISWVLGLQEGLFEIFGREISGRDLILLGGGLFLIAKSTREIHDKLEAADTAHHKVAREYASMAAVLGQILLIDVVFSLDSVITAIGIADEIWIMVVAIVTAAVIMIVFANRISEFVEQHPTMKMLALAFLILIGVLLMVEGWAHDLAEELHLKNYAYFAMAFAVVIELLNIQVRKPVNPVQLHNRPHLEQRQQEEVAAD